MLFRGQQPRTRWNSFAFDSLPDTDSPVPVEQINNIWQYNPAMLPIQQQLLNPQEQLKSLMITSNGKRNLPFLPKRCSSGRNHYISHRPINVRQQRLYVETFRSVQLDSAPSAIKVHAPN
uniref:Uncharacterized protein n=2 Tax=Grammatophora oceanica TaxID=210454 RepID=A0A7S1VUT6_9STRA|mmetsp:Transcript_861/g.1202  ORF Transcript_861/g.1202 Transcript_861/m.1202 type:complete len:120 (+) Transcript_861:420-779(+)